MVDDNNKIEPEEISSEDGEILESASLPKTVMVTDEELKMLRREATEYKDKYLRLLADADNSRKRMVKEKQDISRYAVESIIVDFLQPLDNLENALTIAQQMSDEVKHWAIGFQMILSQFKDVLANNGVQPMQSKGSLFDPHSHDAVEMIETTEFPPEVIIEEFVRGYKIGDRVIRPARVKVAKSPSDEQPKETIKV